MRIRIGDTEIRFGASVEPFTLANPVIVPHVFNSGFFESATCSFLGSAMNLRRNDPPSNGDSPFLLNTVRVYQTLNLLQTYASKLKITADTSKPASDREMPTNLIENFSSRTSCSRYDDPTDAT